MRLLNLRQFHRFSILLSVCCIALQQRSVFDFMGTNKAPGATLVIERINMDANYALLVFFVFLILHSLQWLVAVRLQFVARQSSRS
jgi:hypothetical protein